MTPRTSKSKAALAVPLVIAVVALAAGAYWWMTRDAAGRFDASPETLTVAVSTPFAGSSLFALAEAKGYFAAEGVQVIVQAHEVGTTALEAALAGRAELATSGEIPFMFAVMKGAPAVAVATLVTTSTEYGIVARRDRGIGSPADLKGKRIGVTFGTGGHYFVASVLIRQHLDSSQVRWRDLPPRDLAAALTSGEVDAVGTWQPFVRAAEQALGDKGRSFSDPSAYELAWLLTGKRDVVAARAEAVRRLLRALIRAERFHASDPAGALATIAAARKEDPARMENLLKGLRFNVRLGQSLLGTLEDEARWAIRSKLVDKTDVPNFLDHLYLDGLLAVRPDAVTVIR